MVKHIVNIPFVSPKRQGGRCGGTKQYRQSPYPERVEGEDFCQNCEINNTSLKEWTMRQKDFPTQRNPEAAEVPTVDIRVHAFHGTAL